MERRNAAGGAVQRQKTRREANTLSARRNYHKKRVRVDWPPPLS